MRLHLLRQFALRLPHASHVKQWGNNLVFKVAGKMFLILSLDEEIVETIGFKCSPADFARLTAMDGIIPAPYLARASWVQLEDPAALSTAEVQEQIRRSYALVWDKLPRKTRLALIRG